MKPVSTIFEKRDGKVTWLKPVDLLVQLLQNGKYTLTIRKQERDRSTSQNALMWMWFACIAETTGNTKEEVHDAYCLLFLSRHVTMGRRSGLIPSGTSKLTTSEMKEFLDKVQADAHTELGIRLPSPEDEFFQAFAEEYRRKI